MVGLDLMEAVRAERCGGITAMVRYCTCGNCVDDGDHRIIPWEPWEADLVIGRTAETGAETLFFGAEWLEAVSESKAHPPKVCVLDYCESELAEFRSMLLDDLAERLRPMDSEILFAGHSLRHWLDAYAPSWRELLK